MLLRFASWRMFLVALALGVLSILTSGPLASEAAGFPVSVTTSAITGQNGKMLLFFAEPQAGGTKVACIPINADVFDPPQTLLKEMPQANNPCESGTPDAFIVPGDLTITAGVYVGGSQTPEKQVTATVDVQDASNWRLNGVALTADTAGDSDCDRETDSVDALHVLRHVAGIGLPAVCLAAGNLKCDDGVTSVDSLFILRHVAQLPLNVPQGCPTPLAAPILVSPEDGAHPQLPDSPWLVPLDWDPVPGASGYTVEVDCDGCCFPAPYCADDGLPYRLAADLQETEYTPNLSGANQHRWRVWAINEDGTPGDFSEWRTFDIEVVPTIR